MEVKTYLEACRTRVDEWLDRWLPPADRFPRPLFEAMRYSLFAGGKRMRPALTLAACETLGGEPEAAVPFAAALEMIHTYSLIHDDLPAMDDDDLRRGRPTNHKVFGEGMAVLTGDGLLTDAFSALTDPEVLRVHPPERVVRAVAELARAAGTAGMVGGQALDLASEGRVPDLPTLEFLHTHKTGALIRAAVVLGALAAGAGEEDLGRLGRFAERVGLAFQIADDILDVEGDPEELGKPVGSDEGRAKATYPALLGLSESRRLMQAIVAEAMDLLTPYGERAATLRALARFVVERRH